MTNRLRASSWQARGAGTQNLLHRQFHFKFCLRVEEIHSLLASLMLLGPPDQCQVGSCGVQSTSLARAGAQWPQGEFHPGAFLFPSSGDSVPEGPWTEEFLQHMRALSTAAELADPAVAAAATVDNTIILANHPGDRLWRIFRPDPQDLRRFLFLDLHVGHPITYSTESA